LGAAFGKLFYPFGPSGPKAILSAPKPNPQKGAAVLNRAFCSKGGWVQKLLKTLVGAFGSEANLPAPQA
jgi:hypothetical protein